MPVFEGDTVVSEDKPACGCSGNGGAMGNMKRRIEVGVPAVAGVAGATVGLLVGLPLLGAVVVGSALGAGAHVVASRRQAAADLVEQDDSDG